MFTILLMLFPAVAAGCEDTAGKTVNVEQGFGEISYIKIEVKTETKQEEIPFEVQNRNNPSLAEGVISIEQEGKNGMKSVSYAVTFVNGKELRRNADSETVAAPAIAQIVSVGTASSWSGSYDNGSSSSAPEPVNPERPPVLVVSPIICDDGTTVTDPSQCAARGGACENGYWYEVGCT